MKAHWNSTGKSYLKSPLGTFLLLFMKKMHLYENHCNFIGKKLTEKEGRGPLPLFNSRSPTQAADRNCQVVQGPKDKVNYLWMRWISILIKRSKPIEFNRKRQNTTNHDAEASTIYFWDLAPPVSPFLATREIEKLPIWYLISLGLRNKEGKYFIHLQAFISLPLCSN